MRSLPVSSTEVRRFIHRWRWSADWRTLGHFYRPFEGVRKLRFRMNGAVHQIRVRGGTLDAQIAEQILCEGGEYESPVEVEPRVIFDVGANIGATAMYFAIRYPRAKVFCFEPLPENLELLLSNVAPFGDRVQVVAAGLGESEGSFTYHYSDDPHNFGGGTFHGVGCDDGRSVELPVVTAASILREHRIEKVDLLKLDTEGAEHSVLLGFPPEVLANVDVVLGELHGVNDWWVCNMLERTHRIGLSKQLDHTCYPFVAVRREEVEAIRLTPPIAQAA